MLCEYKPVHLCMSMYKYMQPCKGMYIRMQPCPAQYIHALLTWADQPSILAVVTVMYRWSTMWAQKKRALIPKTQQVTYPYGACAFTEICTTQSWDGWLEAKHSTGHIGIWQIPVVVTHCAPVHHTNIIDLQSTSWVVGAASSKPHFCYKCCQQKTTNLMNAHIKTRLRSYFVVPVELFHSEKLTFTDNSNILAVITSHRSKSTIHALMNVLFTALTRHVTQPDPFFNSTNPVNSVWSKCMYHRTGFNCVVKFFAFVQFSGQLQI